jgi:hypothetical protein
MGLFEPFRGPRGRVVERSGAEIVGIILALGIAGALNIVTFALVYDVVTSNAATAPLSENTTQVLTGWGGGMLAVLAAYIGYTFGKTRETRPGMPPDGPDIEEDAEPPLLPPTPPPPAPKPPRAPKQSKAPDPPPAAGPDYPGSGGQQ